MERKEILTKVVKRYGEQLAHVGCMECCAELQKAITQALRLKEMGRKELSMESLQASANVIAELAAVQIMLDQMRVIYGSTKAYEAAALEDLEEAMRQHANE